ncbi:MAG: DUF5690 family protein [Planctomycetota bacterium]|nr:DUF5690 family protein [Planctomycetota bacterium]
MLNSRSLRSSLERADKWKLTIYGIVAAFSTYFCMYAFRKPFSAATFKDGEGGVLVFLNTGVELKTALVISQILGYALSKYLGIKYCSEVSPAKRAVYLVSTVLSALLALTGYGLVPDDWKVLFIFLSGLPLGMVWGLVVWYLEGRTVSEVLLAGLSCSFILASGIVKDIGRFVMAHWGVSEGWMPSVVGLLFLIPFLISVWLLNQMPAPNAEDELARTHREPMDNQQRNAFVRNFFWGLLMLVVAYFFLTAYRDYRDNYQVEMFSALDYPYEANKSIITQAETVVAFGVLVPLGLLFLIRNNRWGLIGTYAIMLSGATLLGMSTWMMEKEWINGFWWMTCVGLGAYLAYVPYGSVLFDRLIAQGNVLGTAVFAIYIMDALGYTGSVAVQIYRDIFYSDSEQPNAARLEFFIHFSYLMAVVGLFLFLGSLIYFLAQTRRASPQKV